MLRRHWADVFAFLSSKVINYSRSAVESLHANRVWWDVLILSLLPLAEAPCITPLMKEACLY